MAESITLQTSDNNVQQSDVLGRLSFAASNESSGSDSRLIGASIYASAESDFTAISNATSLIFATASSENATERMRITSDGDVGIGISSPQATLDVRYKVASADGLAVLRDGSPNDGILIGEQAFTASSDYQGITHPLLTGATDYMMMSRGDSTYISSKSGFATYIRGGGNSLTYELAVSASAATLGGNRLQLLGTETVLNEAGGNFDFRVEGDTLDYLLHTDASKDEVVIHNAIGYGLNYATSEGWVQATGTPTTSQVGYYGGNFASNGAAENYVDYSDLPNGLRGLVWQSRDNGTDNSTDGGWGKEISGLDPNKTYISIVYFRRVGSSTTGSFYHGCKPTNTLNLNGTTNSNPYFHVWGMANFPQDVWCVSIGIIHANNDTISANSGFGGIYRLDTGEKIYNSSTDYKMAASATIQTHRTYLYYDAVGDTDADWCWPGFYEVTADSIVNLLNTILYDHFSGRNITINEGGGNYDFRVEGDTDQNLLFVDASVDRVGISTAGPDVKLQVNESAANDNNYVYDTNGLMIVHPTPTSNTILNDPKEIFYIVREGTSAQAFGAAASFSLSRYENSSTNSRTRLDIDLAHGAFLSSKTNVMTMRSDGNVGIGTSTPAYKLDVNGTFSANSINVNDQFTFPTTDGSADQVLVTDGSGNITWQDQSGGSTSLASIVVTSEQSVFNMVDTYASGSLAVFLNGVKLVAGDDFTETTSTSFTLTSPATSGDIVDYIAYGATIASTNLQKTGDTMTGNLTVNADVIIGSGNSLIIGQGGSDSFTFPTGDGSADQIIKTDGSGNLTWINPSDAISAAKAWVNFNGTSTVSIRASFNVSSITDNGTGDYTVNFTTAMPDGNYVALMTLDDANTSVFAITANMKYGTLSPSSVRLETTYVGPVDNRTNFDSSTTCVAIFR